VDDFRKVVEKLTKEKKPIVLFLKDPQGNFFVATIENY
jgi:hypothetical protein